MSLLKLQMPWVTEIILTKFWNLVMLTTDAKRWTNLLALSVNKTKVAAFK